MQSHSRNTTHIHPLFLWSIQSKLSLCQSNSSRWITGTSLPSAFTSIRIIPNCRPCKLNFFPRIIQQQCLQTLSKVCMLYCWRYCGLVIFPTTRWFKKGSNHRLFVQLLWSYVKKKYNLKITFSRIMFYVNLQLCNLTLLTVCNIAIHIHLEIHNHSDYEFSQCYKMFQCIQIRADMHVYNCVFYID